MFLCGFVSALEGTFDKFLESAGKPIRQTVERVAVKSVANRKYAIYPFLKRLGPSRRFQSR